MKLRHPGLIGLIALLATWLVRCWIATLRFRLVFLDGKRHPADARHDRYVYAFWHETMVFPLAFKGRGHVLISQHADGELIARVCRHLGVGVVRGSTRRGGLGGLMGMVQKSDVSHLLITPDGPRGPRPPCPNGRGVACHAHRPADRAAGTDLRAGVARAQLGPDAFAQAVGCRLWHCRRSHAPSPPKWSDKNTKPTVLRVEEETTRSDTESGRTAGRKKRHLPPRDWQAAPALDSKKRGLNSLTTWHDHGRSTLQGRMRHSRIRHGYGILGRDCPTAERPWPRPPTGQLDSRF